MVVFRSDENYTYPRQTPMLYFHVRRKLHLPQIYHEYKKYQNTLFVLKLYRICGGMKLTLELSNEQIVTNLLVSNDLLGPVGKRSYKPEVEANLGKYMAEAEEIHKKNKKNSKYSFIDTDFGWNF